MSMLMTNLNGMQWALHVNASNDADAYRRSIVESGADASVRILDARLKRHPWRGDKVEIELRWTCERPMKIRA